MVIYVGDFHMFTGYGGVITRLTLVKIIDKIDALQISL